MEIDELSDNIFFICLVVLKIVQIICENHGKMPDCVWWQAQPAIQWGRHNGGQEIQLTLSHDANKNLECVWVLLMTKNEGPFNFCDDYLLSFQWQWHNREGQQLLERLFKWIYIYSADRKPLLWWSRHFKAREVPQQRRDGNYGTRRIHSFWIW